MQADLTHAEARQAFRDLAKSIGSKAEIFVCLSKRIDAPRLLSAHVSPMGMLDKVTLYVDGDDYRGLLAACEARWAEHSDLHGATTIREMALAIISITADLGECTDAALRAKFDAADVARYGDRACAQATEMAGLGPFSIVKLSDANDAEAA